MDDPTYREKYSHGYSSNDGKKILQMLKRASDARHVDGRKASYRGLAAAIDPATLGVELGAESARRGGLEAHETTSAPTDTLEPHHHRDQGYSKTA